MSCSLRRTVQIFRELLDTSPDVSASPDDRGFGPAATLYRGSAVFLAIHVVGSGVSFGAHLFAARSLGATSYGHFVYATTWMAILILGCTIGLKPTVVRFAAAYRARGDWGSLRGLLSSSTAWTIGASSTVVAASLIALRVLRPHADELGLTLLLVVFAMPFMALGDVWSSAIRGLGAVATSQLPASIVQHSLFAILLLVVFHAGGSGPTAVSAAGSLLTATIGTLGAAGCLLRRELPEEARASGPRYRRREWVDVAGGNALISFFQAARTPLVVVISGAYLDSQHIAFYVAGQKLANVTSLALFGISGFASPLVSRHFTLGDVPRLQRLAHLAARGALAGALLIALVVIGFSRTLLGFFGEGFEAARAPLIVLLFGEIVAAASGPVGFFLSMTGHQMTATKIEAGVSVVAVGLALFLVPRYGIAGSALAVTASSCLRNIGMVFAVRRQLGLRSAIL